MTSGNAGESPFGAVGADTSIVEWDGKGQRAVRALIALLTSTFGRGVCGLAQIGLVAAVTEHIPGLSAHESYPRARQAEGSCRPGRASGGPLGWIMTVTGDRLVASWTVSSVRGLYDPLGGWSGQAARCASRD
jgi:hypothetical protein